MRVVSPKQSKTLKAVVYGFYRKHGRFLPWRNTGNPYRILVSEVMLQQTQADRVIPKYEEFLKKFPTVQLLAKAPLPKVLKAWSGLGYNRRALNLKRSAEEIVVKHGGWIPASVEALDALPGIGYHTACSIMAFAYNKPVAFIETNIRSVYLHHFFPKRSNVSDAELMPLIGRTLDRRNPRRWYSALMDYGSYLKKEVTNPSRRSLHHAKQTRFEGSNRQLRGAVVRELIKHGSMTAAALSKNMFADPEKIGRAVAGLVKEGLVRRKGSSITFVR